MNINDCKFGVRKTPSGFYEPLMYVLDENDSPVFLTGDTGLDDVGYSKTCVGMVNKLKKKFDITEDNIVEFTSLK